MPFGNKEILKPTISHLELVMTELRGGGLKTPKAIATSSGLSLNQVTCALNHLELYGVVSCIEQKVAPTKQAKLADTNKYSEATLTARP